VRVIHVGHACHLVEIDGLRVLTDPWLADPIFAGCCEHAGSLPFGVADLGRIDAIALTHGHLDHLNAPTLAALPDKSIPVVHPPVTFTELDDALRLLGFHNLHPREDWKAFELGTVRIVPTPSQGVLDECAFFVAGGSGRFFDGADAPQPPEVMREIHARLGPPDLAALSHNSFDQPALLGLRSLKPADHAPEAAVRSARLLAAHAALPGASYLRWCGEGGSELTRRVIRRSGADFLARLAREAPEVEGIALGPGDAWSRAGGVERGVLRGTPEPPARHDYVHRLLGTGARHCPSGRPSTEDTFRRDLPRLLAAEPARGAYVGQAVAFEILGADPGVFTVDFAAGSPPVAGDAGAAFALRIYDEDWKDLFERVVPWQVLLVNDRTRVTRFRSGPPPDGLHFAYALQAVFP
jgi:L-ascorbate metabolism protein UlaG (beta-lactamase superfamily)